MGLALALTLCSSLTLPTWGEPRHGSDKIIHLVLFGLMANFLGQIDRVRRCRPFGIYTAALLVSLFGIADELHQHFTPGRSMDVWDWAADTVGACVATWLYQQSAWYRFRFTRFIASVTALFVADAPDMESRAEIAAVRAGAEEPDYSRGSV